MNYPSWVTPPNLGVFSQSYSFNLNPITIQYSAGATSTVTAINGSLPTGLSWQKSGLTIIITGVVSPSESDINSRITFRITQSNGEIADRTYTIQLTTVELPPSWAGQNTFLGYQNNTLPQSYQLTATPSNSNQHVLYSIVSTGNVNVSVSIGELSGVLICNAANVIINSTALIGVRATTTSSSDLEVSISIVTTAGAPNWITPAGALGTYAGDDFIEINLLAEDPDDLGVTYALVSNPQNAPLEVASDGLLYGRLPNIVEDITYSLEVSATNLNGTSLRTFTILARPSETTSLLVWVTDEDLGHILEGRFIKIPLLATTERHATIEYYVSGGVPPPHFMLGTTDGILLGFCEYHAVQKTYDFDVTATDGNQSVIRQFTITVDQAFGDQFFSAMIPLTGPLKEEWMADTSNLLVREPGTITFDKVTDVVYPPTMNIINGLVTGYDTASQLVNETSNWLHELQLQIGPASNSSVSSNTTVLYRNIVDSQAGANVSVYSGGVYNTNVQTSGLVYPISIENIRRKLSSDREFISGGSGSGCILSPVLNWSTGSLSSIQVITPGSGYVAPPSISITGSGTGASARAVLGLVGANIVDTGQGWTVGDQINIDVGVIETTVCNVTVTATGTNGSLVSFTIDQPGDYLQVPNLTSFRITKDAAYAAIAPSWGIVSAVVITGGQNYQDGIRFSTIGTELLPSWQSSYSPVIEIGNITSVTGTLAVDILNNDDDGLYGRAWTPNAVVFQWQGLKWLGESSFDEEITSFDGGTTRFQETESPLQTIFNMNLTTFDLGVTLFDYFDPLEYDLFQLWGANFETPLDMYATMFDALPPRLHSNTLLSRWITTNNKTYSGNNAVW